MFNHNAYNRSPFNRPFTLELYLAATLAGEGELFAFSNAEHTAAVFLEGTGEVTADFVREIIGIVQTLEGEGALTAANVRERLFSSLMQGEGELRASPSRFHIDEIIIQAPFTPGEKIVIDSQKMIVRKSGQVVGYEGDFFEIRPGVNIITYRDNATGRTVHCRITYRDRHI